MGLNRPESADLRPRWPREGGKEGQMDIWKFPLLSPKTATLWGQTALELMGVMGIDQYSQGVQTLVIRTMFN